MTEHEEDHSIDSPDGDQPKGHVARAFWHLAERGRCLSRHPQALWVVGLLSFLESTILPVAIEVVLLPYMLARRDIVWRIASATLLGCIVGACFGYAVGYFLFASLGQWVVDIMGWEAQLADTQAWFDSNGFWAVLAIGVTPVPFQLAMLTAGAMGYPISMYLIATLIARGLRYFGLALLVALFGRQATHLWERHKITGSFVILALVVAAMIAQTLLAGGDPGR